MIRLVISMLKTKTLHSDQRYREWRDTNCTDTASAQRPLSEETKDQRKLIFGRNEIDIEGKSTISLLVDEVFIYHSEDKFSIYSDILSLR